MKKVKEEKQYWSDSAEMPYNFQWRYLWKKRPENDTLLAGSLGASEGGFDDR